MEREEIIRDLHEQIANLTRLHISYGLHESAGFQQHRKNIRQIILDNKVDIRRELDPMIGLLYRRYFE